MASNPYNNKVQLQNGTVLMDLTSDTITETDLALGVTAHDRSGAPITGTQKGFIYYGTCSTAADTQAKTVTIDGITSLYSGLCLRILFTNQQTYDGTPTLNVNNLGAKNITRRSGNDPAVKYEWEANEILDLIYDGTRYVIVDGGIATTNHYGYTKLNSSTSSTSTSEAATPSAVKAAYDLAYSKQDSLTFDSTPTQNSTNPVTSGGVRAALPVASSDNPQMDGTAAPGSSSNYSRKDHVHPSDTTRVAKTGDTMTGYLLIKDAQFRLQNSTITVGTKPSSNFYGDGIRFYDKVGTTFVNMQPYYNTSDELGIQIGVLRTVSGTLYQNRLRLTIGASGVANIGIDNGAGWRSAIGAASTTDAYYSAGNVNFAGAEQFVGVWASTTQLRFTIPLSKNTDHVSVNSVTGTFIVRSGGQNGTFTIGSGGVTAAGTSKPYGVYVQVSFTSQPAVCTGKDTVASIQPNGLVVTFQ